MSLPPFNPNRPQPKSDPGLGDDEQCRACGAVALDTGLECSECGADNWEAITGKPFGTLGVGTAAPKRCDCAAYSAADCVCGAWDALGVALPSNDPQEGDHA